MKSYGSSLSNNWASSIATANNPLFRLSVFLLLLQSVSSAPLDDGSSALSTSSWETDLTEYLSEGCYYQYRHYDEGKQIITNEPCLNCTCHNQVLMCYLRVCPFIKPVGQKCIIEKNEDQCCPTITCPQVPVELWTSTTLPPSIIDNDGITSITDSSSEVALMTPGQGCQIDGRNYMDGMQIPRDPNNPCELCYCIRNHTACVMQECRLNVKGCEPIMREGSCCPIKYICEDGLVLPSDFSDISSFTTSSTSKAPTGCMKNGTFYEHGASIESNDPCQHCYCMQNEVVCAVEPCMGPLEGKTDNCVPQAPSLGECCPSEYKCTQNNITLDSILNSIEDTSIETSNMTIGCTYQGENYESLTYIPMEDPCDLCQCVNGKIICAKRECAHPPSGFNNCKMMPVKEDECCPNYECEEPNVVNSSEEGEETDNASVKPESVKEDNISNEIAEDDASDYDNYEENVSGDHANRPLGQDEVSEGDRTHIDGQDLNKPDVGIVIDDLEQNISSTTTTTQFPVTDETIDSNKMGDHSTDDKDMIPDNNELKEDNKELDSVETTDVSYEESEEGSDEAGKFPSIEAVENENEYNVNISPSQETSEVTEGSKISDATEIFMDQEVEKEPSTEKYNSSNENETLENTSNEEQHTDNETSEDKDSNTKPETNNNLLGEMEMKDTTTQNDDDIELNTIPGSSDIHFPKDKESDNKDKLDTEKDANIMLISKPDSGFVAGNDDKEFQMITTTISALYEVPTTTAVPNAESYDETASNTIDSLDNSDEQSTPVTDSQKDTSTTPPPSPQTNEKKPFSTTTASPIQVTSSIKDSETTKTEENVAVTTPSTQNENELFSGNSVGPIQDDDDYDISTTEAASISELNENNQSTSVNFSDTTRFNEVPTTTSSSNKEFDSQEPFTNLGISTTTFASISQSNNETKDDLEDSVENNITTTVFDMNISSTSNPSLDSISNKNYSTTPDISSESTLLPNNSELTKDETTKIPLSSLDESSKGQNDVTSTTTPSSSEAAKLDESSNSQEDSISTTTSSSSDVTKFDESSTAQDDDISVTASSYPETTNTDESSMNQDANTFTTTPLSSEFAMLEGGSKNQDNTTSTTTPSSSEVTKLDESSMSQNDSSYNTTPSSSEVTKLEESIENQNNSTSTTAPSSSEVTKLDEFSKSQEDSTSTTTPSSSEMTKLDESSMSLNDSTSTTIPSSSDVTKLEESSKSQDDSTSMTTPSSSEVTKLDESSESQNDSTSTTAPSSSDVTNLDESSKSQDDDISITTSSYPETTKTDESSKSEDDTTSSTAPSSLEATKLNESSNNQDDSTSTTTPSSSESTKIENTSTSMINISLEEQVSTTTASSQKIIDSTLKTVEQDEPTKGTSKAPVIDTESSSLGTTIEAQKEAATDSPRNETTDNSQDAFVFEAVAQDDEEGTYYETTFPTKSTTDFSTPSPQNNSSDGNASTTSINESVNQSEKETIMTQDPTAIQFPDSMNDSKNITVVPSHQKADQEKDYENETSTSNEDYESTNQSTVSIIDMFSTYAPDILSESDTLNQVQDDDTVDVESTTLEIRSTCLHNGVTYQDFDDIASNDPCEVCYCNYGQVVCSKMVCNKLEGHEFCRPLPPKEGKCCPDQYECLSTTEDHMANVTIQSVTTKPLDPSGKCDRNGTIYENGADVPITSKCYNSCTCINTEFICDYLPCKEAPQLDGLTCTEVPVEGECCPMFKCDDLSSNEISTQIPLKNMNSTTSGPSSSETTLSTLDETSIGETTKDNVTDTSILSMSQEVKDEGNESEIQEMTSTNASNVSETTVAPTESGIDSMNATNINATFPSSESSMEKMNGTNKIPEIGNNLSPTSEFVNNKETTVTPTEVTSSENMETVSVAYQTTEKSNVSPSDGIQSSPMTTTIIPDSDGNVETTETSRKNVTLNESNASTTPISEGATTSLDATTPSSTNISVDKFEENTTNFGSGIETTEKIDENVTNPSSETGTSENTNENATTVSGGFETSEKTDENATTVSSGTETSKETYENATTVSSGIETSKETDENATTVSSAIETSKETDENATTVSSAIETSETTDESATTVSSGTETLKETDENATTVSSGIETSKETDENTTTASSAIETSEKTDENATTVSSGTETSKETDENATSVSTGIGTDEKTDENATTVSSDIETSEKTDENTTTVSSDIETSTETEEIATTVSTGIETDEKTDENATTVSSDIETSGKTDENTTTVSSDIETSTETEENATTFSSAIEISTETEENATTVSTGIETDENERNNC
uniref:Putative LOC100877061 [Megachile rotundata] n=1 Tax=Lepeophtheirus salmonis TaxID=72036 RepID=A0A0K2URE1_LEPSM